VVGGVSEFALIEINYISFLFPRERPPRAEASESGANRAGEVEHRRPQSRSGEVKAEENLGVDKYKY